MKILILVIFGFISKSLFCQSYFEYSDTTFEVNSIKIIRLDDKESNFSSNNILLDSLSIFLIKNNSLSIELGTHSTCKGGEEYNLLYTEHLATNLKNELLIRGVDGSRITTKAYSNLKPIIQCDICRKCSKEALYINKRIEVKIVKN